MKMGKHEIVAIKTRTNCERAGAAVLVVLPDGIYTMVLITLTTART